MCGPCTEIADLCNTFLQHPCVFNAVCHGMCSLHCLLRDSRPVQHILTTPSVVHLMPCVFLALPGKGTADLCNTFFQVQHLLVCFQCRVCSLHCLVKNTRPAQNILTTPSGVFLMPCVCSLHRLLKKQQTRATHSYKYTLWCVFTVMPYVFLALPGIEAADLCNTFLQQPLVCF